MTINTHFFVRKVGQCTLLVQQHTVPESCDLNVPFFCKVGNATRNKELKICCGALKQSKMNKEEVSKQIQQMVHFIRQEAEEKTNEIAVSAEEVLPEPT